MIVCVPVCQSIYEFVYMCMGVLLCVCKGMYVCMYVCMCVFVYLCVCVSRSVSK